MENSGLTEHLKANNMTSSSPNAIHLSSHDFWDPFININFNPSMDK